MLRWAEGGIADLAARWLECDLPSYNTGPMPLDTPSFCTKSSLVEVLESLVDDRPLEPRHRDHPLAGEWHDHRDCHLRPDLVLIYRKSGEDVLQLVRLGSHSELGL